MPAEIEPRPLETVRALPGYCTNGSGEGKLSALRVVRRGLQANARDGLAPEKESRVLALIQAAAGTTRRVG